MDATRSHWALRLLIVAFAFASVTLMWASVSADAGTARTVEQDVTPTPLPMTGTPAAGERILVIEGPVAAINVNVINIYNFNIVVNPSDPVLQVIQLGDILRVTGSWDGHHGDDDDDDDGGAITATPAAPTATVDATLTTLTPTLVPTATIDPILTTLTPTFVPTATATLNPALPTPTMAVTVVGDDDDGDTIIIINVINITFVNVTVVVEGGQVWRDDRCDSPPPPWAQGRAVGWQRRCGGGGNPGNGNGNGHGNGNGNGHDHHDHDDDDDDD